jgi:hypothetical protein
MKTLAQQLSQLWPTLISNFQTHINKIWVDVYFEEFSEWIKDKETQEITKVVSPLLNAYLKHNLKKIGFILNEGKGLDYVWEGVDLEGKLSLSSGNSWTGNGFPKTNWHLLIKINFNDMGNIIGSHVCIVPINDCVSSWTKSGDKDNFSTLKLKSEDLDKIVPVVGTFKKNPVYLKLILAE